MSRTDSILETYKTSKKALKSIECPRLVQFGLRPVQYRLFIFDKTQNEQTSGRHLKYSVSVANAPCAPCQGQQCHLLLSSKQRQFRPLCFFAPWQLAPIGSPFPSPPPPRRCSSLISHTQLKLFARVSRVHGKRFDYHRRPSTLKSARTSNVLRLLYRAEQTEREKRKEKKGKEKGEEEQEENEYCVNTRGWSETSNGSISSSTLPSLPLPMLIRRNGLVV